MRPPASLCILLALLAVHSAACGAGPGQGGAGGPATGGTGGSGGTGGNATGGEGGSGGIAGDGGGGGAGGSGGEGGGAGGSGGEGGSGGAGGGGGDGAVPPTCDQADWTKVILPTDIRTLDLHQVFARTNDDVWVVGRSGHILHGGVGMAFEPMESHTQVDLNAVWAAAADDAWAVGYSGTILHWDGSSWSDDPASALLTDQILLAIFGTGPDDVWASGAASTILHRVGGVWTLVAAPAGCTTPATYDQIWGLPGSVWIAGSVTFQSPHWTGLDLLCEPLLVYRIWGTALDDVWRNGEGGLWHWDGMDWTFYNAELGGITGIYALWGRTQDDYWIAGKNAVYTRFDGKQWIDERTTVPGVISDIVSISGPPHGTVGAGGSAIWMVASGNYLGCRADPTR